MQTKPQTLEEALKKIDEIIVLFENAQKEIALLREENLRLKEQLNINSKNSSLPPSRDLKKKPRRK